MAPLVSVVVPTYNRAHLIERTIDSVFAQSYEAFEIIVVDDGSSDGTRALIGDKYGADARVRYVYKANGGPAAARNVGFAHVRGDYVALLDSDDVWHPWKLALQVRCMERFAELVMSWTDMQMIDAGGAVVDPAYLRRMYNAYQSFTDGELFSRTVALADVAPDLEAIVGTAKLRIGDLFAPMVMGNLVHTSTVLLRRATLARVGGFNEALRPSGEDYDFHLRTCREGPVGLVDLPAIRYQQGMPDRLTAKKYAVHIAENAWRTIEPVLRDDGARITLPAAMLRRRVAGVHAWIGFERLERGERRAATAAYLRSLRHVPWQPRLARDLVFAALPFGLGLELRDGLRALRARTRSREP